MSVTIRTTRVACNTSTGAQDITIPGFGTPKAAMFIMTFANADDTAESHAQMSFGATDGTNQWACGIYDRDNEGVTQTGRRGMTDECIFILDTAGGINGEANFDSWITDGVRINWGNAPGLAAFITVILVGGIDLSAYAAAISPTGTEDVLESITSVGFTPDAILTAGLWKSTDFNDAAAGNAIISTGFAVNDGSETQRALGWFDTHGVGTTDVNAHLLTDRILGMPLSGLARSEIQLNAFTATGFDITAKEDDFIGDFGVLALSFNGVVQASIATVPTVNAATDSVVTGFKPNFLMSLNSLVNTVDAIATGADAEMFGIGVADESSQFSNLIHSDDLVGTSDTKSRSSSGDVVLISADATADTRRASVSFTSTGYDLTYSDFGATIYQMAHLAISSPSGIHQPNARHQGDKI